MELTIIALLTTFRGLNSFCNVIYAQQINAYQNIVKLLTPLNKSFRNNNIDIYIIQNGN